MKADDYYNRDVWRWSEIGMVSCASESQKSISFIKISPQWLKELSKKYLKQCTINLSIDQIMQNISSIKLFSKFLMEAYPDARPESINRELIESFLHFISIRNHKATTKNIRKTNISLFLKACYQRKWIKNIEFCLFYPEDYCRIPKNLPRDIPETVISQLNQNIIYLDGTLRRMILTFQELGLRISELLLLKFDCLSQDADGDFWIKFFQSKLNKEHTKPVSKEIVQLIREQQKLVQEEWGKHDLLFPVPHKVQLSNGGIRKSKRPGSQWRRKTILLHLNNLAKYKKILGPSGEIWHFDSHSFRHTTGTRMINSGVPQHIIQQYFGHESPTMTSIYARIHDETLKREVAKLPSAINIAGEVITPESLVEEVAKGTSINNIDAKWLKKNILMQSLPNGTCSLPAISKACPHANACLSCTNFRTDKRYLNQHKEQLEQTKQIVNLAKIHGWKRQEEMNTVVQNNLEKIITSLESNT